jgi:hypothetical protein
MHTRSSRRFVASPLGARLLGGALLVSSLSSLGACDDDDCSNGIPSCAAGTVYIAKSCECRAIQDAGSPE